MRVKIHNTEIIISYTLICIFAISIVCGVLKSFAWCLMAVVLHETGHLIPIAVFGEMPRKIKMSLFEISIADKKRLERSTKENIIIIFSGPFANFICFILFYLLYLFYGGVFLTLALVNLFTGLFNMLPVLSLDGGQLLYIALCKWYESDKAQKIVNVVTFIFIFPISALGFLLLFATQYNFSLLGVSVYLMLSLVLKKDAI